MAVVIETTIGDITVDLYTEERPQTCKNFLKLCKLKYYNFSLFHTVQSNFIAQTGDPSGSGTGGESVFGIVYGPESRYYEGEKMPKIKHTKPGLLSMVNCGSNMYWFVPNAANKKREEKKMTRKDKEKKKQNHPTTVHPRKKILTSCQA